MSWWGKVVGGTFGFFLMGGPMGALLGAALGNYFDGGMDRLALDDSPGLGQTERVQSAFFTALFSLMGFIAKADGRVTREEISLTEHIMDQMQLSSDQRQVAMRLFDGGKEENFPFEQVLEQFRRECFRRRQLIQMFLEILTATALADGTVDSSEEELLILIAERLGYSSFDYQQILGRVKGHEQFSHPQNEQKKLDAAYRALSLHSSATDQDVKKMYRKLMNQHHPDKLVAKGLPEEMLALATQKTQEIKAAYELIKKSRG